MLFPHTPRRHASSAPTGDILQQAHRIRLLHRIAASADDRARRSHKKFSTVSFPTGFMTHDLPRKKSH